MINISINTRVILLSLMPVTLVSIILFSVFITKQLNDIDNNLIEKGDTLAEHLSSASEFGIFARNVDALDALIDYARRQPEVINISILDENTAILATYSRSAQADKDSPPGFSFFDPNEYIFNKPVRQTPIDISDFQDIEPDKPAIIGWVNVTLSDELAIRDKTRAITNTLFITVIILWVSGYIALRIGRYISQPIITITNTVREIEAGNLDASLDINSTGELLALANGIKAMTASLKDARHHYLRQINDKTLVLEKSLKIVEKQNEDLLAARQVALAASRAKSEFLANISHEIRTPMNGIIGYIRLLLKTHPSREQTEYLETIEKSAVNLLTLLNDVIDLSRVEAGKLDIQYTEFSLRECIEDIQLLMAPSAYDKKLELTAITYKDTPDRLFGAPDRIRQILINLVGNAIKFSNAGTIVIRSMLENQDNNSVTIKISVSDQGIGISKHHQERIFSSFTQIDNSITRKYEGAGLGLAISKSLADAMGGSIGVDSESGEGATFWFTFSADLAADLPDKTEAENLLHDKYIIIYDLNEITGLSLSHELSRYGCSVDRSHQRDDFFRLLKNAVPPLMLAISLSDKQIEQKEYEWLIEKIRLSSAAPILVFVSSSDPVIMHAIKRAGADACLPKPHRSSDLRYVLTEIWDHLQASHQSPLPGGDNQETLDHAAEKPLAGITILIAEDNEINARLIHTLLHREGAKLIMAKDGKQAIDLFRQYDVDIILMDIHMPELSGIDATNTIRGLGDYGRATPIIGLTANTQISDYQELVNAGMNSLLTKPVSSETLVRNILYWVQRKAGASAGKPISADMAAMSAGEPGVSQELEASLREMLIKEMPDTVKRIKQLYAARHWPELQEVCHKFLGGMSYCNLPRLKSLTREFYAAIASQPPELDDLYHKLLDEMERCIATS